jgi:hypothetical protein
MRTGKPEWQTSRSLIVLERIQLRRQEEEQPRLKKKDNAWEINPCFVLKKNYLYPLACNSNNCA